MKYEDSLTKESEESEQEGIFWKGEYFKNILPEDYIDAELAAMAKCENEKVRN